MMQILQDFGLTQSEAKVYLALLDQGETTIGPLADKSQVAYSKIYLLLQKLKDKGLCTYITKQNTKYFSPTNPKYLLSYIERKETTIKQQKEELQDILPNLTKKFLTLQEIERAEVYEGYESFRALYHESLDNLKEKDEIVVIGATLGIYTNTKKYDLFFKQVNVKRQEKKIKYRLLVNENMRDEQGVRFWKNQPRTQVKFLLQNTLSSVNIQANKVLIIYWKPDMPKVFSITSQIVADSFRQFFEVMWNQGKD